jgi:hypothetical protein
MSVGTRLKHTQLLSIAHDSISDAIRSDIQINQSWERSSKDNLKQINSLLYAIVVIKGHYYQKGIKSM